jgi:hypothetical protein
MIELSLRALKTPFVAVALSLLVSPTFARIGETEQQIEVRYGKSTLTVSTGNEPLQKVYQASGLNITVTYIDGVSQREIFIKQHGSSELTKNEIAILLEANAAGSKWIEDPIATSLAGMQGWKLKSGGRTAAFSRDKTRLVITTDIVQKAFNQRKAEDEKEKLKGF